jgi:hypothetical protein
VFSPSSTSLNMVLEKPAVKKISKLETLKVKSENLIHPLKEVRIKMKASKQRIGRHGMVACRCTVDTILYYIIGDLNIIILSEVMQSFFPRLIDTCRRKERPRPVSQWTIWG